MRVHRVLAVAVVWLFLVGLGFGQDNRRAQPFTAESPLQTITLCDCGDFLVKEDWVDFIHGVVIYDKDGVQVRQVMNTEFRRTNTYYNASNPELFLIGSPGEGQNFRIEDGILYMSGLFNKVVIPGYGRVVMETGLMAYNMVTGEMLSSTGLDADYSALCDFLRPKP